ncbi:MAG: Asp-tRNA(Asn)/Glu-tRNA(Gln) amidotransferase subunit GatB [Deltaproteobacteria bacterium]|nr:Asp-tRNA(Asn)/Glu-tRNA(Gln) amidotransferase subunit GatB [Deltaproteobacteria bacterium]NIS78341.1 Asp-tRNA(Asn)/Glu-tRNA(Gln) amidotransferase subunit GatB [Deltaproteobacteria bacterium]
MEFEAVIGLEVHAQLKTDSKIFCACSTAFGRQANSNTCPVCTGMPGVLPVLNRKVVDFALKAALATGSTVRRESIFARKNYFYPDLPKGYQISQYELPIAEGGFVEIDTKGGRKRINLTRIHMEEDAGKLLHEAEFEQSHFSLVDFNRTAVPLLEIVSEPEIRSPEEGGAYLRMLRDILVYLDICDGNMEEGSFRCDANVSVRPRGQSAFGTKTELKNMNSFRNVEKALEYEIGRQIGAIEEGGQVIQETRLWDVAAEKTVSMRTKEEAHDYRYFPDPDLVPLEIDEGWIEKIRESIPELPLAKRDRFQREYNIPAYDSEVLCQSRALADFFEAAVAVHGNAKAISNLLMTEVLRELNKDRVDITETKLTPSHIAGIVKATDEGVISGKIGKEIFQIVYQTGDDPVKIIEEKGLRQVSDEAAIEKIAQKVIDAHPGEATTYREGKKGVLGFFVGQVMRETKGKANPALVNEILKRLLEP